MARDPWVAPDVEMRQCCAACYRGHLVTSNEEAKGGGTSESNFEALLLLILLKTRTRTQQPQMTGEDNSPSPGD